MELPEDELIAAIRRVLSGPAPEVEVGLGDDAAVVAAGSGSTVLTTDMLIEGVHFERSSISPRELGAKSIVVNVSDVAAMAGSPRYALASIGVSDDVDAKWVVELAGGMRAACDEYALSLVGGDTNRAGTVVISVTVVGEVASGRAVTRSGARPGDLVVVTGSLGAAAGGLALSRRPAGEAARALSAPWGRALLDALVRPVARVGEGQTLGQAGATAMMDLSDGLAKDLSRLCAESGVGVRLDLASIPVAAPLREGAAALGVDPLELALSGGEDYELLATIDATDADHARARLADRFGVALTEIGVIIEEGLVAVGPDGVERPLRPTGWDHFRR
ncbi:MAG: thiamine-phosphate kinase [Candidatus Velamenicoccus archaeovorus]